MTKISETRTLEAVISNLYRRTNSADGNPRYSVWIEGQETPLHTADDMASVYSIESYAPQGSEAGKTVTLTLTGKGEITKVTG